MCCVESPHGGDMSQRTSTVSIGRQVRPKWMSLRSLGPATVWTLGLGLVLSFCIYGLLLSLRAKGFGADAAAWVQAGGSIAAIAGAAWVAAAEGRRQRRQRRLEREEVAWGVRFALKLAVIEASTIAHELIDPALREASKEGRHWQTRCRNAKFLLQSYANRPDHIHPAIAQEAYNGVLIAEDMESAVLAASESLSAGALPSLSVAEDIRYYEVSFARLLDRVDTWLRDIARELDSSSDILPVRRWIDGER